MKIYLPVNLIIGFNGIYLRLELAIMPLILFYILRTLREKCVKMYEKIVMQLQTYAKARRIVLKGYLPISFLPPSKL